MPPVVKNLLILNVLFFLADISLQTRGIDLTQWLGLHYITAQDFYPWQFITYMFMHGNFSHLFFNITGVGAALIQTGVLALEIRGMTQGLPPFAAQHYINQRVTVGASGAVYGILLAFGMCFPNVPIFLYFFFPIKAKWFVIIYGVIELFAGIGGTADGVAHFAHLGGMIFGLLLILYWRKHGSRIR